MLQAVIALRLLWGRVYVQTIRSATMKAASLRLEKMVHGGKCLARLEDGQVALLRGGIPGELVRAEVQARAGVLQGEVCEVQEPSPERREASLHPGLDYSFISDAHQLELKYQVVADALERQHCSADVLLPCQAAPQTWHYRYSVQPAPCREGLGYRQESSHLVQVLEHDPVAHASINALWPRLSAYAAAGQLKGVREVVLRCNDAGELLMCLVASASERNYLDLAHRLLREEGMDCRLIGVGYASFDARGRFRSGVSRLAGKRHILQRYGDFVIQVSSSSFAQPNPAASSLLYARLQQWAGEGQRALDMFAGSGIIAMHLCGQFAEVLALELDKASVVRGQQDAERLGIDNLHFLQANAKQQRNLPEAELICLDPPRSGLSKDLRAAITASTASRLLYVSCDVATWARDVADLQHRGFRLVQAQPYDFYPQTHHIEMLSVLER